MEARVKVSVRFSWKFSQKMIQKSRSKYDSVSDERRREEASFFIIVFIHLLFIFLFISICCESLPDVAYMPETYTDAYVNAKRPRECHTNAKDYVEKPISKFMLACHETASRGL